MSNNELELKRGDKVRVLSHGYSSAKMAYGKTLVVTHCQQEDVDSWRSSNYASYIRFEGISKRFRNNTNNFHEKSMLKNDEEF